MWKVRRKDEEDRNGFFEKRFSNLYQVKKKKVQIDAELLENYPIDGTEDQKSKRVFYMLLLFSGINRPGVEGKRVKTVRTVREAGVDWERRRAAVFWENPWAVRRPDDSHHPLRARGDSDGSMADPRSMSNHHQRDTIPGSDAYPQYLKKKRKILIQGGGFR